MLTYTYPDVHMRAHFHANRSTKTHNIGRAIERNRYETKNEKS